MSGWRPDGKGVTNGGDTIGGDRQYSEAHQVRYVNDDVPGALVNIYTYAVRLNPPGFVQPSEPPEYGVEMATEWMTCTDMRDPGGTERWADYDFQDLSPRVIDDPRKAEALAREHIRSHRASEITWDGRANNE